MIALYNQSGRVYAWLHETGKIYSLSGQNLAFVDGDSVYSWGGRHIAWWENGHVRDHFGAVALFTPDAVSLGVVRPIRAVRPIQPIRAISPIKPIKSAKPSKPMRRASWANNIPF